MINKVILVGNVGREPELKSFDSGNQVLKFSLATTETWVDKSGSKQKKTEWHNILVWGKMAGALSKFLKKGAQVYLEGKIVTESWEKDGSKRERKVIQANILKVLGSKDSSVKPEPSTSSSSQEKSEDIDFDDIDIDDI